MWGKTSSFRMTGPSGDDMTAQPVTRLAECQRGDPEASLALIMAQARACTLCAAHLPLGPRPVLRGRASARLLVLSQAPGTRVHETGLSFNDRSGDRLRAWMDLDRDTFYDESRIAIMPMGFCYPGRYPRGGD